MLKYLIETDNWETPPALASPSKPTRVLILGAGMAGLTAGYELMNHGYEVRIVEARATAGGRVQTLRDGFSKGVHADAGAMFLPVAHGLVHYYLDLLKLNLTDFSGTELPALYYVRGKQIEYSPGTPCEWPYPLSETEQKMGLEEMQQKFCSPLSLKGLGAPESTEMTQVELEDSVTLDKYMAGQGATSGARELLNVGLNQLIGEGPSSYSAAMMLRSDHYLSQNILKGQMEVKRIAGGNDQFPAALASRLDGRISYSTEVVHIAQEAEELRVTCRDPTGQHDATADYVICTLPFSVLRNIPVAPGHSAYKDQAVQNLRYTSVTRIFLEMRQQFWRPRLSGKIVSDQPMTMVYPGYDPPDQTGVLGLYMGSDNARRAGSLSLEAQIEFALGQVGLVFPEARQYFTAGVSKFWDADPFARGAYSWFTPGEMGSILPAIAVPEGRLYFAGDHASTLPGWIQGAIASGLRAAQGIAQAASGA